MPHFTLTQHPWPGCIFSRELHWSLPVLKYFFLIFPLSLISQVFKYYICLVASIMILYNLEWHFSSFYENWKFISSQEQASSRLTEIKQFRHTTLWMWPKLDLLTGPACQIAIMNYSTASAPTASMPVGCHQAHNPQIYSPCHPCCWHRNGLFWEWHATILVQWTSFHKVVD